jgi:hypothetical protein
MGFLDRAKYLTAAMEDRRRFMRVFDGPDGEAVLREIARLGFMTKSTFCPGDPNKTALNEGARRLALDIFKRAKVDPVKLVNNIMEETD